MTPVAVIGGGITGLVAAFELQRRGVPVTLYEATERVGGVIKSVRRDGFLAEFGGQRASVALFATVRDASRFLENELKPGDLLVLKGSGATDHLERIVLTQEEEVGCWRAQCGLVTSCDDCARLGEPGPLRSGRCGGGDVLQVSQVHAIQGRTAVCTRCDKDFVDRAAAHGER